MKYQSSITRTIYELDLARKRSLCPECSDTRKKAKNKDLEYYQDTNTAYCFHCNATFFEYKPFDAKQYKKPEWKNKTKLTDRAVKYFESRKIRQDVLNSMKIYSDKEYMPQFEKDIEVICFPYFVNNELVNIKYRGANKSFKMYSGAKLVFYNFDALLNNDEIIITEGEIDALTWIACNRKNVISVPNGASNNTDYLDETIELLSKKEKVYISTDIDSKGIDLRDELVKRIGFDKCYIIDYKGCKDVNEYLMKYDFVDVLKLLDEAKLKPIEGIIKVENIYNDIHDYYLQGDKSGLKINVLCIDDYITWETSRLAVCTGIPSSGKSEFIDYILVKLNLIHGWKSVYFTPENYPLKYHYEKIYEKLIGKKFNISHSNEVEFDMAYEYINDNFFYILPEESTDINFILNRTKFLIKSKGIKCLVIDPYNKLDHQWKAGQSETNYISCFLDKLTHFCKLYDILIILIAHPRKIDKNKDGEFLVPTLYDIAGSANFYNKTDYGFTVHRTIDTETGKMNNEVEVYWQKIKFKNLGTQGVSLMNYNYNNGRFEPKGAVDYWDNKNYLVKNFIQDDKKQDDKAPF